MATKAAIGHGTQLQKDDGAGNFTTVAEVTKIKGPSLKADSKDASNMDSPGQFKEYIQGLNDPGEVALDGNFLGKLDATQQGFLTDFNNRTLRNWKVIFPGGQGTFTFAAFISAYSVDTPTDSPMVFSATLKISGVVTLA